ncbi:MAG: glutamate--tRNA ligase, partial [Helcococcus sp.]|nr:glutamate--tRNA ligase [Helcococcus sp.]
MTREVRVRFAPSPTGYVHIGGLRTALYNYLFARHNGGKFILRIEDTDRTRYVEGALENLIDVMEWAGLEYDEGVFLDESRHIVEKGPYGPYIQSERVEAGIYKEYIQKLLDEDKAYYCFCTQDRLDNLREQQKADGLMPRYDGLCRGISREEAEERVKAGEEHVVRIKLPANKDIHFKDAIKGNLSINTSDMDDQVLMKSDGFPTYHFAVVVDDHLMKITHVVRGDEWVSSTPKHVYLYEAFGWEAPTFVHLPTVLGKDK